MGDPDPLDEVAIARLSAEVVESKADIGLAYDADGDRLSVTDHTGTPLSMSQIVSVFAIDMLNHYPKSSIVFNTLCSPLVEEVIRLHQGNPILSKTGRSFIKQTIDENQAVFGGEYSGHLFFAKDFYGHDDSLYATLRLLAFLENQKTTLEKILQTLPKYFSSVEIKIGIDEHLKFDFVSKVQPALHGLFSAPILDETDGLSLRTEDSYLIIRPSQNGPYLTIRFDSKDSDKYQNIKVSLKKLLQQYPELDWHAGTNLDALD